MSCADRPRKEKDWGEKLQEFVEDVWGTSDFAETPFNNYTAKKRERDYEKILNKMVGEIEQAKTEAKIEVLEEVMGRLREVAGGDTEEEPKDAWESIGFIKACAVVEGALGNLKKKKKK